MNSFAFRFAGHRLEARPTGALWWPAQGTLIVSDLHLGKPDRIARRAGLTLPPYGDAETLDRLSCEIQATGATRVISLGDGFDDDQAARELADQTRSALQQLMAARDWIWISGNHDPTPPDLGGRAARDLAINGIVFRHIAEPPEQREISGHYHPKARLALKGTRVSRPAFLIDPERVILPAFGAYTGGLDCCDPALAKLMGPDAIAVLTGQQARPVPMPRVPLQTQLSPAPPRRFG